MAITPQNFSKLEALLKQKLGRSKQKLKSEQRETSRAASETELSSLHLSNSELSMIRNAKRAALKRKPKKSMEQRDYVFFDIYAKLFLQAKKSSWSKAQVDQFSRFLRKLYKGDSNYSNSEKLLLKVFDKGVENLSSEFFDLLIYVNRKDPESRVFVHDALSFALENNYNIQETSNDLLGLVQLTKQKDLSLSYLGVIDPRFTTLDSLLQLKDKEARLNVIAGIRDVLEGALPRNNDRHMHIAGKLYQQIEKEKAFVQEAKNLSKIMGNRAYIVKHALDLTTDFMILTELRKRHSPAELRDLSLDEMELLKSIMKPVLFEALINKRDFSRKPKSFPYSMPSLLLNAAEQIHADTNNFIGSIRRYSPTGAWQKLMRDGSNPTIVLKEADEKKDIERDEVMLLNMTASGEFVAESDAQNICIGRGNAYVNKARAGMHHYFSLRNLDGSIISTLELAFKKGPAPKDSYPYCRIPGSRYHLKVLQNYGRNNSPAGMRGQEAVQKFFEKIQEGDLAIRTPDRYKLGDMNNVEGISDFENITGTRFKDKDSLEQVQQSIWARLAQIPGSFMGNFGFDDENNRVEDSSMVRRQNSGQIILDSTRLAKAEGLLRQRGLLADFSKGDQRERNPLERQLHAWDQAYEGYHPLKQFRGLRSTHGIAGFADVERNPFDNYLIPKFFRGEAPDKVVKNGKQKVFEYYSSSQAFDKFMNTKLEDYGGSLIELLEDAYSKVKEDRERYFRMSA